MAACMITDKQREVIEEEGWTIHECTFAGDAPGYELSQYSPAGEDFSFAIEADDLVENVREYYVCFDPDEHIEMWIEAKHNGVSGVPSARELVEDADAIEKMLESLWTALRDAERSE